MAEHEPALQHIATTSPVCVNRQPSYQPVSATADADLSMDAAAAAALFASRVEGPAASPSRQLRGGPCLHMHDALVNRGPQLISRIAPPPSSRGSDHDLLHLPRDACA